MAIQYKRQGQNFQSIAVLSKAEEYWWDMLSFY
jgi:hypothetical protein